MFVYGKWIFCCRKSGKRCLFLDQHLHPTNTASGELYWDDGETWIDADSDLSSSDYYHLTYNFTYSQAKAQLDVKLVKKPEVSGSG